METGYGTDGTIWGGEFLRISESDYTRYACLRPFPLPGGDQAVKEPKRSALGLLYEYFGEEIFWEGEGIRTNKSLFKLRDRNSKVNATEKN